ncbi:hypothetical protein N0V90_002095 [Kalmusia sp. IMI 367209]|nr:hypothetical protein N0V90_002095 [Kalmusia sp. IMI 367209]
MARVKRTQRDRRLMCKRLSWISFHLPHEEKWPKWSIAYPNLHLGPLTDIPGCEKVSLGRQVEHPENAVFIIHWETADALHSFEQSPMCSTLLHDLGCETASLLSLQWEHGFFLDDRLYGRVTLSICAGPADRETWHNATKAAFRVFIPKGCNDVVSWRPPRRLWAITWVDGAPVPEALAVEGKSEYSVRYEFFRWNSSDVGKEREEASFREPGAKDVWAEGVANVVPPALSWAQERWDIEIAPEFAKIGDEEGIEDEVDAQLAELNVEDE